MSVLSGGFRPVRKQETDIGFLSIMIRCVFLVKPHLIQQSQRRKQNRSHEKCGIIERDINDLIILRDRSNRHEQILHRDKKLQNNRRKQYFSAECPVFQSEQQGDQEAETAAPSTASMILMISFSVSYGNTKHCTAVKAIYAHITHRKCRSSHLFL